MDKKTILIVDDDKFLLDMYLKKFKDRGAEVQVAESSEIALNKLRDGSSPNVLLLDIIMPTMDGIELLKTIRKEKLVPDAKVVMLTNESDKDRIEEAKSLGISGYIVKAMSIPTEVVDETFKIAGINS